MKKIKKWPKIKHRIEGLNITASKFASLLNQYRDKDGIVRHVLITRCQISRVPDVSIYVWLKSLRLEKFVFCGNRITSFSPRKKVL